jgi:hypothetical protein
MRLAGNQGAAISVEIAQPFHQSRNRQTQIYSAAHDAAQIFLMLNHLVRQVGIEANVSSKYLFSRSGERLFHNP